MWMSTTIVYVASSLRGSLALALVLGMLQAGILESLAIVIKPAFQRRPWWPRAWPLQAARMKNFGYEESACTEAACLGTYALVCISSSFHIVSGTALLPVVIRGWAGVGEPGQALFFLGTLADAGLDIFELIKYSCLCFLPAKFEWWGPPPPLKFFIQFCYLHHTIALATVIPMNLRYPDLPAYQWMCCSLLLCNGICFAVGAYKFTLDVSSRWHLVRYRVIVLVQLVAVWASRGVIWPWTAYVILRHLMEVDDMLYFGVGNCTSTAFMLLSLFALQDATCAAIKRLPTSKSSSTPSSSPSKV